METDPEKGYAMNGEDVRVRQAEFLTKLYESETGKKAEDIQQLDEWLMAKSKIERQNIAAMMERYVQGGK